MTTTQRLRRAIRPARTARTRGDQGAAAVETLIMATAAMALVVVVVAAGRYADGPAQANDAAYAAARAASLEMNLAAGSNAGRRAAAHSLADRGKSCINLSVSFAGTNFTPGGQVIAHVSCTVTLLDTGALGRHLGLRPRSVVTERAVVPLETYRDGPS